MMTVKDVVDNETQLDDDYLANYRKLLTAVCDMLPTVVRIAPREVVFYNYVICAHGRRWVSTRARFSAPIYFKDAVRRVFHGQLAKINCTRENLTSEVLWLTKKPKKVVIEDPQQRHHQRSVKEFQDPKIARQWLRARGYEAGVPGNCWERKHTRFAGYPPKDIAVQEALPVITDRLTHVTVKQIGPV